ncbi:adenylate/guanylate cyclase domain-containing protein [Bacillus sp. FJAT-45350]|uniref:adenylate/guanylate cyclase domain-containing protein n=1 Tax=Bacillus sp. FJAT-45350 TaxID=2011014 RepID=UPI0015CE519C|nr:adenylate/guanylate cyclase domain-containing protein [Bacillus sp. FJAT-45350]
MRKLLSVISIFLVVATLYFFNFFYIFSNNLTDLFVQEPGEADPSIKILAINDESLEQVGRWPWSRDVIAGVSELLAENGATAVFVDVLYTESSETHAEDDEFQRVLNEHQNIFLPVYFHLDQYQVNRDYLSYQRLNKPIYQIDRSRKGHINAWEGSDRVVREVLLGVPDEAGEIIPAMGVQLANLKLPEEKQINWNENNEWFFGKEPIKTGSYSEAYFSYTSTPTQSSFATYSIGSVLNGEVEAGYFNDSIVLIGPYTVGLQDLFYVPQSQTRMFGVEIHANIVQSLLEHTIFYEVSKLIGLLIIGMVTVISFITMERVTAKWAILVCATYITLYTMLFNFLIETQNMILPFFYALLAIVFSYVTSVVSHYLKERRERSRVTGIFGRYVAKSVVTEILSNREEIQLGGERKDVTLLFVDIRGFTTLSEKIEPEEVINILNEYLDLCTRAIFKYEGTLDKFMGDGVMAIFGAPVPQEDHAKRAVQTALEMKRNAGHLALKLEEKYGRTVSFGIGINTGPAVIGNIGSKERLEYTAIGDTVNLAARLESNAKPGQILISEDTYHRVKGDFEIKPLDVISVKGKEKKVMIYQVEGEK